MVKSQYRYKMKKVCPECMSASIKPTKENKMKCYNCMLIFVSPIEVGLMHKDYRCIDNNVSDRKERYDKNKGLIIYE